MNFDTAYLQKLNDLFIIPKNKFLDKRKISKLGRTQNLRVFSKWNNSPNLIIEPFGFSSNRFGLVSFGSQVPYYN